MSRLTRAARLMVGIGWDIGPLVFALYVGLGVVTFLGPMLLAIGLRPLVDGIAADDVTRTTTGALLCAAALVMTAVVPPSMRWTTIRLRERAIMIMQRRVLMLATRAPRLSHFERPEFWDRLQLLRRSSFDLVMGMTLVVLGPIIIVQLVVTAVLLGRLQPALMLLPFLAVPAGWLTQRAEQIRRDAELATAHHRRSAQHLFMLASGAASAKEVRVYGLQGEIVDRHRVESDAVHRGTERALARSVAVSAGGWLMFAAAYLAAILLVLRRAAADGVSPGDVAMTLGLAASLVAASGRLTELAGSALRALSASDHYLWLEAQTSDARGADHVPSRLADGIDLDAVSFSYAGADRAALVDVTLHLPAGGVVAVVGENGAGKTTLVKLLAGMYAPSSGRVLVDGADLESLDLDDYRRRVTAGFQDFMRYELVAREAVGVGDVSRIDDDAGVRVALGKVNAGFAERLPAGLDTQLGRSWQGGVDLSGGEWQKLALARAMVRDRALLLILDEPTASLDPQTEHALFEQVVADARRSAEDGRVTVLISHRFSTVRMADLIVVLDDGRIIEQGTHDELIAGRGLYAELYELQATAYR